MAKVLGYDPPTVRQRILTRLASNVQPFRTSERSDFFQKKDVVRPTTGQIYPQPRLES